MEKLGNEEQDEGAEQDHSGPFGNSLYPFHQLNDCLNSRGVVFVLFLNSLLKD